MILWCWSCIRKQLQTLSKYIWWENGPDDSEGIRELLSVRKSKYRNNLSKSDRYPWNDYENDTWRNKKEFLALVRKPMVTTEKPTVVDEDALLMKAESTKAKPIWKLIKTTGIHLNEYLMKKRIVRSVETISLTMVHSWTSKRGTLPC